MPRPLNRNASDPITPEQAIDKAKLILRGGGKGPTRHDRMALFLEYMQSDPAEFPTHNNWRKAKHPEVNKVTFSANYGGALWWNKAREAFRAAAMAKALDKNNNRLANQFSDMIRVKDKVVKNLEKILDLMDQDLQEVITEQNPKEARKEMRGRSAFNAELLSRLTEASNILTDIQKKIDGTHQPGALNLNVGIYDAVLKSLGIRNKEHGVIDVKPEPPGQSV